MVQVRCPDHKRGRDGITWRLPLPRRHCALGSVFQALDTGPLGTTGATEDHVVLLDAVAYYLAATMLTDRRQGMDGALKRVKSVFAARLGHRKCLVVIV